MLKLSKPNIESPEYYELRIEELEYEIIGLHAVVKAYQKQLEEVIEHQSIESYRRTVRYNSQHD